MFLIGFAWYINIEVCEFRTKNLIWMFRNGIYPEVPDNTIAQNFQGVKIDNVNHNRSPFVCLFVCLFVFVFIVLFFYSYFKITKSTKLLSHKKFPALYADGSILFYRNSTKQRPANVLFH